MRRSATVTASLGAVLALGVTVAAAQETLTPRERRRLAAGELVRRPQTWASPGRRALGGTSWLRVRASEREVWAVVTDVRRFPRILPGVVEARELQRRGARRLVFIRHRYGMIGASYHAWVTADRERRTVSFELDRSRPRDVRSGRGFLTVSRSAGGRESIVTWGIRADVGAGLLTGVIEPLLRDWILRVPECVRAQVEPGRTSC